MGQRMLMRNSIIRANITLIRLDRLALRRNRDLLSFLHQGHESFLEAGNPLANLGYLDTCPNQDVHQGREIPSLPQGDDQALVLQRNSSNL
jgi:hypothetical protein